MPILFMALLALLALVITGALLCAAVISESRQRAKMARRPTRPGSKPQEAIEELELLHR